MIGKLIGLASIGSSLANLAMVQRFLEGLIGVIVLSIVGAAMTSMLLIAGLYGSYRGLTYYGLDHEAALVMIASVAVLLTAAVIGFTLARLRHLREISLCALPQEFPHLAHIPSVINAFLEGLTKPTSSSHN